MRALLLFALALSALLAVPPASATSYVPVTDEALVDQAAVIAVVEIQGSGFGQEGARPFTGYRVRVERVLKGSMASGLQVTVRVPGGVRSDGMALRIWGAPRFAPGERALLFLSPRLDGTYEIVHLMLGAFHETRGLALRDLSEARAVGSPSPEPMRDFERFVRWISNRVRGIRVQAGYQVAGSITSPFSVFKDPADGYSMRWFEFDQGESVDWYLHEAGQQGLAGGGLAEFQTAIAAWNDDPESNIAYAHAGTTTSTDGLTVSDTVNAVLFNDPNDEVPGTFSCFSGGVLAIGGPWYEAQTTTHHGIPFHRIVTADIVTNDDLSCYFAGANASSAARELFAHEVGHTLGIGHSDQYQALMYPYIHNDGRGAALHGDDLAAAYHLYGVPTPRDFFALAPCRLIDTREPGQGQGPLYAQQTQNFETAGKCGIPSTAVALSVNVTAVTPWSGGYLKIYPAYWPQPETTVVSFSAGRTRSSNAILLLSGAPQRAFTAFAGIPFESVHLVVDVNGYFE